MRAMRAMSLRGDGWKWIEIADSAWPLDHAGKPIEGAGKLYADAHGMPCRQRAQAAVDALLIRYASRDIAAYRQEMVEQLDGLIAANMDGACGVVNGIETNMPIADAVKAVQFAMERKSKLLGLDAPAKQELTGKDGKPLFECGEGLGSLLADMKRMKVGGDGTGPEG